MCRSHAPASTEDASKPAHKAPDFLALARENEAKRGTVTQKPQSLVLKNVRVFDGTRIGDPASIAIADGLIVDKAPSDATELDCNGSVLLPGLIDAHVHPLTYAELATMARIGVTTAMSMANFEGEHMASLRHHAGVTDMLLAGLPAAGPTNISVKYIAGWPMAETLTDPAQAEAFVDRQLARGADYIKIIADVPGMSQEIVSALVDASKKRGKQVMCHAAMDEAARQGLRAGAEQLHHSPMNAVFNEEDIALYKEKGSINCPTLTAMEAFEKAMPRPGTSYVNARDNVAKLHKAGVTILAGTDANETPQSPVRIPFATSMHRELELLAGAGLSNLEILRAATALPAKHFGLEDRGVVAPGCRADLLLVKGDPLVDITNTKKVEKVWVGGVEVQLQP